MAILDNKGQLLENKVIAGSDFDNLDVAEMNGDSIVLSVSSQSDDGDFAGSNSGGYPKEWVITVDGALEIVEKRKESGREYADDKIGEKDGVAVFGTDKLFKKYDLYDPNVFIDYGDFYLILSENRTGKYENQPPFISSTWYYTETVYSAYNYNGRLLFRASVDSSPDYDARIQELNNQS